MAHVAKWKEEVYKELVEILTNNPVVGLINIGNIPSPQMQTMRRSLRNKAQFITTKNTLITLAIKEAAKKKKGLDLLLPIEHMQTAVVVSKLNPFKLYKELEATKTKAPARGGEKAPDNIEIKKGDTPFKPGPVVGELQKIGIPAAIESGKVIIKKDIILVKKGEIISRDQAQMMSKLDIFPLIVGLDLNRVYEEGIIYKHDSLAFDDIAMINELLLANKQSISLALKISYISDATITLLLQKAYKEMTAISLECGIVTKDNIKLLLTKANSQAKALTITANINKN